jgi:hypothetical protein
MANRTAKEVFKATEQTAKVRGITFGRPTEGLHGEEAIVRAVRRALSGELPNATLVFTGGDKADLSYDPTPENIADLLD